MYYPAMIHDTPADTLSLARAAFGALVAAVLVLAGHGIACRQMVRTRADWWLTARWATVADGLMLAGRVLLASACVLVGMAAVA